MMKHIIGVLLVVFGFGLPSPAGNDGIFPMSEVYGDWRSESGIKVSLMPFTCEEDGVVLVYVRLTGPSGDTLGDGVVTHNLDRKTFRALLYDSEGRRISVFLRAVLVNRKGQKKYKLEMRAKYLDPIGNDEGFKDGVIIGLARESSVPNRSEKDRGTFPGIRH